MKPRDLLALSVIGALPRVLYVLLIHRLGRPVAPDSDSIDYAMLARGIAAGRGFAPAARNATEAMFRPPLYPYFLAGVQRILPGGDLPVMLIQALIGGATAAIAAATAARLFGRRAGWFAGTLYALHPLLIYTCGEILTETLFAFLFMGSLYLMVRAIAPAAWTAAGRAADGLAAASGAAMGLAILCRPTPIVMLPVLVAALVWIGRGEAIRRRLRRGALYGLAALAVIAPWIARGVARYHAWVPIATTGEFTFYIGNAPGWAERVLVNDEQAAGQPWDLEPYRLIPERPPGWFAAEGRRIILQDPGRFARLCAIRAVRFFKLIPVRQGPPLRYAAAIASYTVLFPLGVIGLALSLRRRGPFPWVVLVLSLGFSGLHIISLPLTRYRIALIDAPLMIFAGAALAAWADQGATKIRRWTARPPASSVAR